MVRRDLITAHQYTLESDKLRCVMLIVKEPSSESSRVILPDFDVSPGETETRMSSGLHGSLQKYFLLFHANL